jgi:hypothetical protein
MTLIIEPQTLTLNLEPNINSLFSWISYISKSDKINSLNDLNDGVILLKLLDNLTKNEFHDQLIPKFILKSSSNYNNNIDNNNDNNKSIKIIDSIELSKFQKIANLNLFMSWLNNNLKSPFFNTSKNSNEISINGISSIDFLDNNEKLILGFLWSFFWNFVLLISDKNNKDKRILKQELLCLWISNKISKFENTNNSNIQSEINFHSSTWIDGELLFKFTKSLNINIDIDDNDNDNENENEKKNDNLINKIVDFMYQQYQIPKILNYEKLENNEIDDWSIFIYFSFWFDIFNDLNEISAVDDKNLINNNNASKNVDNNFKNDSEFNDFFGPNILSKASAISNHDYDISLKLKIETFLVINIGIIKFKNKFLMNAEKLLFELIDLLAQFAEFENFNYNDGKKFEIIDDDNNNYLSDIDLNLSLIELEKQLTLNNNEFNNNDLNINEAIKKISLISNYRNSTKQKIHQQFIELKLNQLQLSELLKNFGLKEFNEPPEKSIFKISKFIELLNKSEENSFNSANDYVNNMIKNLETKINENNLKLLKSIDLIESEILKKINPILNLNDKIEKLENLKYNLLNLKKNHLRIIYLKNNLELIYSSLSYGFNKTYYKFIINNQRHKIEFVQDLIDNSIKFLINLKNQKNDVYEIIKISEIAHNYENDLSLNSLNYDERQLKVHLLVHKLIQNKFKFDNIDPIKVLFDENDIGSKNFLTKKEFKKAFLKAYPNTTNLGGLNEIDTIFETSYETVGKVRRGMEFKQFETIIKLGYEEEIENKFEIPITSSSYSDSTINVESENNSLTNKLSLNFESNDSATSIDSYNTHTHNNKNNNYKNDDKTFTNLTSPIFENAFKKLCNNCDKLQDSNTNKINLNNKLHENLKLIFPNGSYADWFEHVDESSIYQDNDNIAGNNDIVTYNNDVELKNVLYELEKVDLSKI